MEMRVTASLLRIHEHRMWVNERLGKAAASLSEEQLHRQFTIGQGSVWRSLTHLYAAEYVWLACMEGRENAVAPGDVPGKLPGNQEADDAARGLDDLMDRWRSLDAAWRGYLQALEASDLDLPVYRVNAITGARYATVRHDALLHVCTHAHYTSAQVVNMLRQLGQTPTPDLMLITMAREQYLT